MHSGKTAADDHHMGGMAKTFFGRFPFKEEMAARHGNGEKS